MRSASRLAAMLPIACGCAVAGCVSTQQTAAWIQLNDARIRASEQPVRVTRAARYVEVVSVAALRSGHGTAFVVELRNLRRAAVSDLALSVGFRGRDGRLTYLNAVAGLPYFADHTPAIGAGQTLRWVLTSGRALPPGARPVARVGEATVAAGAPAGPLPAITARAVRRGTRTVTVLVSNRSGVPQYQLQIYGYAQLAGRYTAAASASIATLAPGASATVRMQLGSVPGGELRLEAPATMLQ